MIHSTLLGTGRVLNVLAAIWMMLIAFTILADVIGRGVFGAPLQGTAEIVANSVVAIVFLQFPYAVGSRAMIYTPMVIGNMPFLLRKTLTVLALLSGAAVFAVIAHASVPNMLRAWNTWEYLSEGALRVPTVFTRIIIIVTSILCALAYLSLAWKALRARPSDPGEEVMP